MGHPSKESKTPEFIAKMTRAVGERNEIECSFGTGKRIYRANNIRAKLPETSECWTGMCYFVRNVMKFLRELCLVLFRIWLRFKFFFRAVAAAGLRSSPRAPVQGTQARQAVRLADAALQRLGAQVNPKVVLTVFAAKLRTV